MGDVDKVRRGPSEEPSGAKRKKEPDSDAFREMMRVKKTDPEEHKKKKSQTEAEEDLKAEQTAKSTPGQGLGDAKISESSLFETKEGVAQTPPTTQGEPTPEPSPSMPPDYQETPPSSPEQPQATGPSKSKKHKRKKATHRPHAAIKKGKKEKVKSKEKKEGIAAPVPPKKGGPLSPLPSKVEEKKEKKVEQEQFPAPPLLPPEKKEEKKTKEKVSGEQQGEGALPVGAWEASHEEKKEKKVSLEKETRPLEPTLQTPEMAQAASGKTAETAPLPPIATPFANLPPQIQQIFERMVGVMTVMNNSGIKETTMTLDNPSFQHSVFYGAQIVVSEFSTAPKQYNIEILGNQNALNLVAGNESELVAAFAAGKYTFSVHRVDTGYLPGVAAARKKAASKVKRKKSSGG